MNKKEAIIPLSFILLSASFIFICVMVFFTKGKSSKWIARKMKIGGILLTLTAVSCNGGDEEVTCYVQVAPNSINLDIYAGDTIAINLDTTNVLTGTIYEVNTEEFSFALINKERIKVQKGILVPKDGQFNAGNEEFSIKLDKELVKDVYELQFFETNVENQKDNAYQYSYKIQIK